MSNHRIIIFGEALFDCFEDGRKILGGAPFNVAWHLNGFGVNPFFVSRVGQDPSGQKLIERMNQWGMDTEGVQSDPRYPTGHVNVCLKEGQPSYEIPPNQSWDHISPLKDTAPRFRILYHGTLALRQELPQKGLAELLKESEATVFLDVNLREPWWSKERIFELLDRTQWLKLNQEELDELTDPSSPLEDQADHLFSRYSKLAVIFVTQGERGAVAFRKDAVPVSVQPRSQTQSNLKVIDTVGAGDAFSSVLLLGIFREWPLEQTLERAQAFASEIVQQPGATALNVQLYQRFKKAWRL